MHLRSFAVIAALTAFLSVFTVNSPCAAQSFVDVAAEVDRLINQETQPSDIKPCDDETFIRRVYLDVVGQLPSLDDILVFGLEDHPDKRRFLLEFVLDDQDYGTNWANYWRDVITYRRTNDQSQLGVLAFQQYLAESLNENKPWDEIARDLITASGDIRENGETGLIAAQQGRPEETVSEISRIFMGIQIQCAQCHDHPTDQWTRQQFHELAAFFPRVAMRPQMDPRTFLVYAIDRTPRNRRQNNNNRFIGTLEHNMPNLENPAEEGPVITPKFFMNDKEVVIGTSDASRRSTLADWVTDSNNQWFAKALTNRMWSELVGEGFCEPVDDLGPDREVTAPEAFDYLAGQFAASGYDLKWLIATIMSTESYQRESRDRRNYDEVPFQANVPQPLRSDQLFDSLLNVFELEEKPPTSNAQGPNPFNLRNVPRFGFANVFGYDPNNLREEVSTSIPQALAMMNSTFINQQLNAAPNSVLGKLLREVPDNQQAVKELYLRVLARRPNRSELNTSLNYIRQVGDRSEAFADLIWALINTTEFKTRK